MGWVLSLDTFTAVIIIIFAPLMLRFVGVVIYFLLIPAVVVAGARLYAKIAVFAVILGVTLYTCLAAFSSGSVSNSRDIVLVAIMICGYLFLSLQMIFAFLYEDNDIEDLRDSFLGF